MPSRPPKMSLRPTPKPSMRAPELSSAKRGYGSDWRKLRGWYIQQHPFCEDCKACGKVTPAVDVHHIKKIADRPDLRLEPTNLRALCKSCHDAAHGRGAINVEKAKYSDPMPSCFLRAREIGAFEKGNYL